MKTLQERGFGFDFAATIFAGPVMERQDIRQDYGETRTIATGEHPSGAVLTVVYTDRADVRWIVSARRASRKERRQWRARP